jgi:hypothetical protein
MPKVEVFKTFKDMAEALIAGREKDGLKNHNCSVYLNCDFCFLNIDGKNSCLHGEEAIRAAVIYLYFESKPKAKNIFEELSNGK